MCSRARSVRAAAQRARAGLAKRAATEADDDREDESEEGDSASEGSSDESAGAERAPERGDELQVLVYAGASTTGRGKEGGRAKKRPRGEWHTAEVVRVLRSGSFEVMLRDESAADEEAEEPEARPQSAKLKLAMDDIGKEWRFAK